MVDCLECDGECCKKLAIEVDEPETEEDFDDVKWYLYHEGVSVFQDKNKVWCVLFDTKCKHLDENGKCEIYEKRPPVCREYSDCDLDNKENYLVYFETPEDVDRYVEELKREGKLK